MRMQACRWPWLAALVALLALVALPAGALAADFGQPVAGQRVYDRTGALEAGDVARIEERAAAVEQAGSPVVVFLQARDTDYDQTVVDGRDLMEQWDVQSAPDARDGVVIFFNLQPDNLEHGTYAVIAGKTLIDGSVPQYELDRIAADMRPLLGDGDIAGAIVLALERIERDLTLGPPPPPEPSAAERFADDVAGSPFSILNALSVALSAVAGWLLVQRIPTRRTSDAPVAPATFPPSDLPPALAGSLVAGSVGDTAIGATLLDLTARGALAIEPEGKKKIQMRLLDESLVRSGYERLIWDALAGQAEPDGVITDKRLGKVRSKWGDVRAAIRAELVERGWFDTGAGERRKPFWIAAAVLGTVAIILAAMIPNTTPEGDEVAAPWRGYQRYLKSAGKNPQVDIDLDTAVPYALALSAGQSFSKRLKEASAAGYLPAWMGGPAASGAYANGFYPYWVAFNSSVAPSSSGAGGGSGASGGSF